MLRKPQRGRPYGTRPRDGQPGALQQWAARAIRLVVRRGLR